MNKFAISILLSAGTFVSVQVHASDRAVIGAVDGALIGSYYGGSHGAVAGAIIGAAIGSSSERYDDRRFVTYPERGYVYGNSAPVYYAQPAYETYYEPRYEPQRVVYVQQPVYESYPVAYPSYRAPAYASYYSAPYRSHYVSHHGYNDHRYYDRRGRY